MSGPVTVFPANGVPSSVEDAPGSILAQLRATAQQARDSRTLDLPVGGAFGDDLVIRYHGLPVGDLDRYTKLADQVTDMSLALDMMVTCCTTVLFQGHDLGVTIGSGLWDLLGYPPPEGMDLADMTPRQVIDGLWHDRGMALGTHVGRLAEWQTEETVAPGESSGLTS